jgi:hypothetical protein
LDVNPSVSYKVHMDRQFQMIATEPVFDGIYGIEEYLSSYADEEYLRWAARLYRHYCIEGRTDPATDDPYVLNHLQNPDFDDGLAGWQVEPAETGSIGTLRLEGHGWLEGRYPRGPEGDSFLLMRRGLGGPNRVSQRVGNLQPDRAYSLKMYVGDRSQLTCPALHPISVSTSGADCVPERSFQGIFANCYSHHIEEYGDRKTYFNFLRHVFIPRADSSRLQIRDWATGDDPGGPEGQELIVNFVQVEPFFGGDGRGS